MARRLLLLAFLLLAGAGEARAQAPPVVAADGGGFAVAVPGLIDEPALAGDAVVYAVGDAQRNRLLAVGAATAAGARTLYAPRPAPAADALALLASPDAVALLRTPRGEIQSCAVGGDCSRSRGAVVGGTPAGPLTRRFGATERLPTRGGCRHRIAQVDAAGGLSLSGDRLAYVRRVRCLAPRRRGRPQVVVRDLGTGALRVVRHRGGDELKLAGAFLAVRRRGTVTVVNLRSGRAAYRVRDVDTDWIALGADGTLVRTAFSGTTFRGRLVWHSVADPRAHVLTRLRVAAFSTAPIAYADGRIVYVAEFDPGAGGGTTLAQTDLDGNRAPLVRFEAPDELQWFGFDGARVAYAHTRYRPDRGRADDGLAAVCRDDRLYVPERAAVVEVHPLATPARTAAPPVAAPHRSRATDRPTCPYRD